MVHLSVQYLPGWLPGAGFKRVAEVMRKHREDLVNEPFETVKKEMVSGKRRFPITPRLTDQQAVGRVRPSLVAGM